ncbi:type II toxin-antitoxin system Y4mF family antitoxin [Cloacibacillus porcorum]|nr:type II toxin-antitoxin system Y4mF family antitoxin [Synergistaceae bacterium]
MIFLNKNNLAITVKKNRKKLHLTQVEAAERAGVGLRFIRELECGKKTLRMDKVNDLLFLFGLELGPVPMERDDE